MVETVVHGFDITRLVGNIWYFVLALIIFDVVVNILASAKERKINSSISFNGILRKVGLLTVIAFVTLIDAYLKANGEVIKLGIGMIVITEVMSIVEGFSRLGINVNFLSRYFDPNKIGKDDKE